MKVHLSGPESTILLATANLFRERGDQVSHANAVPLDADLYLFFAGHEAMKLLARGLVVLDLRHGIDQESVHWAPYADLCLVGDSTGRTFLAESHRCEPERIYVVSSGPALLNLLDQACSNVLPPAPAEKRGDSVTKPKPDPELSLGTPSRQFITLAARLEAADRQADVMLRGYQIRSRLPLIGPLVAWIRRNLTSHLREPYLDPTLERQVALNHEVIAILREMIRLQAAQEAQLGRLYKENGDE